MRNKLIFNSISGTVLFSTRVIITFVMAPLYIRILGNSDYGLWEMVMSVMGYMGLLDLGIGVALVQFVSISDGKKDSEDLKITISTAFFFFLLVAITALVFFLILSKYPQLVVGKESSSFAKIQSVFVLLGLNAGIMFPLQVFIATLMGVQRHYLINNTRIITGIIQATVIYHSLQLFSDNGLFVLALLTPVFTSVELLLFSGVVYFDSRLPNISISAVRFNKAKAMLLFGTKSSIMIIANNLKNQTAPFIIGHIVGIASVVYYIMPYRLIEYSKNASMAMGLPLAPYFGASIGRNDHNELVNSWLHTSLVLQVVTLAMPVIILFCGKTFLGLWIGQEYAQNGQIVLYILTIALAADAISNNAFRILTAQGKHGKCALLWLVLSVIFVPAGVLGARMCGIEGVAFVLSLLDVIGSSCTLFIACKVMHVSIFVYLKNTLYRVIVPVFLLLISFAGLRFFIPLNNYIHLIVYISLAYLVYLYAVWMFTLDKTSRKRISLIICSKYHLFFGSSD